MRHCCLLSVTCMLVAFASVVIAGDLKAGLEPGDSLEAFTVEKVAGAVNDGVETGEHLCYRCKLGGRPAVMVFARKANGELSSLMKQLDKTVAEHADQKLASFVNLLGDDPDALKSEGKKFAADNKLENVAVVVPDDHKNGPDEYKINPEAELTVIVYREGKVAANHAYKAGEFNDSAVQTILKDTAKLLE